MTTVTLLRHQNTPDTFVDWLQLAEVGTGYLDRVARNREDNDVLPGMKFVFIFHHLWPLPIILNARSLQRELLDLD